MGQVQAAVTAEPLDVSKITQLKRSLEDKLRTLTALDQEVHMMTIRRATV